MTSTYAAPSALPLTAQTYIDDVRQGQGLPMTHFAPPGIFGAPPIDEVGIGFDPEFAQAELAEAGYPNCEGFPGVTLLGYSGQSTLNWIEFAQANWAENLGCDPSLIQIEQQSFAELLAATAGSVPDEDSPHMWTLGWGPDYADENNWVGDVLWCENPDNRQKRDVQRDRRHDRPGPRGIRSGRPHRALPRDRGHVLWPRG